MSSGVDRYAYNIVQELDGLCAGKDIEILIPPHVSNVPEYKNIKKVFAKSGKFWTQGVFGTYARLHGCVPVNLCNEVSVIAPKGIVCLHDVCYAESEELFPQIKDYPRDEIDWFNKIYQRIKKKAEQIITVSEFSKGRIVDRLGIARNKIAVIGNGWQHFSEVKQDENVLEKYSLQEKSYFFTVSSPNKNKNLSWVLECAKANPEETFVVAGKNLERIIESEECQNVIYIGFARDEQMKTLMAHCKAFIFPSYYEGFGIPPLEALSTGCRIIVSDRASLPEIFGDSAVYISPDDPYVNLAELLAQKVSDGREILERYSWKNSARKLNALLG
jgi:glycosyltransferase involved in cell wall biosynthesis